MSERDPFADLQSDLQSDLDAPGPASPVVDSEPAPVHRETWLERSRRRENSLRVYRKGENTRLLNIAKRRAAFMADHSAEYAWMQSRSSNFDFARAMCDALNEFGHLTQNQLAAVRRCLARETAKREEPLPASNVAGAGFSKLVDAFARASRVIKHPALEVRMLGDMVRFKPAKADSKNASYIYVNVNSVYMGKIAQDGGFFPSRDCEGKNHTIIVEIARDPLAAAVASGHATGRCAVCSRRLDNPESVERGIGPVCYDRMFG